jgi:DNA (cytosine-5)-methyltransferase 1
VDTTQKPPAVLSLCSGYGGLEEGVRRVFNQITVLAHVEIEAFAVANLVNKMETGRMVPAPVWTDLKTFRSGIFRGAVDILTGGYPCQPFSAAGKRLGEDDPRHLWPYITTIIKDCEPKLVFFENVEGHLSCGIVQVLADLEEMGYRTEVGIFSAAEVGAPHQRKRVFILGYSEHNGCSTFTKLRGYETTCNNRGEEEQGKTRELKGADRPFNVSSVSGCEEGGELANSAQHDRRGRSARSETRGPKRSCSLWPSRPGEEQYEWEEPRVVADTKSNGVNGVNGVNGNDIGQTGENRTGGCESDGSNKPEGKTQPELGRKPYGTTDRTDRLRLLGNGVVPQTAEKAFRTLYNKLINNPYFSEKGEII